MPGSVRRSDDTTITKCVTRHVIISITPSVFRISITPSVFRPTVSPGAASKVTGVVDIFSDAQQSANPLAALPVLYHLMWKQRIVADLAVPLSHRTAPSCGRRMRSRIWRKWRV
jgi:hypothetical protein